MTKVLIAYATRDGHTRSIAQHLAASLAAHGVTADLLDAAHPPSSLAIDSYSFVVLAASLHGGKHESEIVELARAHRAAIESVPNALLTVSLVAATIEDPTKDPAARAKARADVDATVRQFCELTGLHPDRVEPVAGALLYRRYNLLVRFVMRQIAKRAGGPTDTSKDYVFTRWESIDALADDIIRQITAGTEARPAGTSAQTTAQPSTR